MFVTVHALILSKFWTQTFSGFAFYTLYTIWALVEQALLTNLEFAWTGTFLMPKQKVFVVKVYQWQLLEIGCQIATLLEAFQFCILWWRSVFLGFCTLWKTFLMKLMNYRYQMHSGLKVCFQKYTGCLYFFFIWPL